MHCVYRSLQAAPPAINDTSRSWNPTMSLGCHSPVDHLIPAEDEKANEFRDWLHGGWIPASSLQADRLGESQRLSWALSSSSVKWEWHLHEGHFARVEEREEHETPPTGPLCCQHPVNTSLPISAFPLHFSSIESLEDGCNDSNLWQELIL